MKLYRLKDSVTEEMLSEIHLDGLNLKPTDRYIKSSDIGILFGLEKKIECFLFSVVGKNNSRYLPPEWLEEVGEGADLKQQDEEAFNNWPEQKCWRGRTLKAAKTAWLAALNYERGRK